MRKDDTLPAGSPIQGLRILIVEDERLVAADLEEQLTSLGYRVCGQADSGRDAVVWATTLLADLVLMDIRLRGEMDGIDAAAELRKTTDVPVIFLTAHADAATLQRAGLTEPFGYVLKPFDSRELQVTIEMAIYRHRAEMRLRKMERWLATTLKSIGDGDIATDRDGKITFINAVAETLTGWERREALGRELPQVFSIGVEAGPEETSGLLRLAMREGLTISIGEGKFLLTRGGGKVPVDDSIAPIRDDDGQITGCVVIFRDNSKPLGAAEERRKLDLKLQETQKLESLGVLAGGIAHDFNNLLTGVVGNASLARMEISPTSPILPYLEQIEEAAMRAAELCKQMLAYAGKGRLVVQNLDLTELVQGTIHLLQSSMGKGVTLRFDLASGLPAMLADATQVRQIVMNLVINAAEAIEANSGVIEIRTGSLHADRKYLDDTFNAPELSEGNYVYLEVSDTGAGMPPETIFRIFDPFFTTKFTGRGLGLAAVLGIVRSHHGALKVSSEMGKGTKFRIIFPSSGDRTTEHVPVAGEASAWRGHGLVLVVDDEATVRTTARRMLESTGFTVLVAQDGREGVDCFRSRAGEVRAVLLDLTMPVLDGEGVFGELRSIWPDVKVLLMSGYNEKESTDRFSGKGLAGFLQKPFTCETLRAMMQKMLV